MWPHYRQAKFICNVGISRNRGDLSTLLIAKALSEAISRFRQGVDSSGHGPCRSLKFVGLL
jgi:hypothetical protein